MVIGQQLGRAIKERRHELGQTQEQAAAAISAYADPKEPVTKGTVSEWERGKSAPHPRNAGPLAKWLGQPVSRVMMMVEDAELPVSHQDATLTAQVYELMQRQAATEEVVQRIARENVEQQKEIARVVLAVLEAINKNL